MDAHSKQVVKTSDVIGKDVINAQGENLGKIEEIVLDKLIGEVRYVVLSFGGFLGMGDKLYALPWKSISYMPSEDSFVLSIDKDRIKNAPGFDKNNWPDFANITFTKSVSDFYI